MNNIIFNPNYIVKPDNGRALLMPSYHARINGVVGNGGEFVIHPVHAIILNFLSGSGYIDAIDEISAALHVATHFVEKFIMALLDKTDSIRIKDSKTGAVYIFPPNTIISVGNDLQRVRYPKDIFLDGEIDIRRKRHSTPSNITLMLNNKCVTDCFYCYADKRKPVDCTISFDQLVELIKEAKKLYVNNFDVIGGEFFLYKDWDKLLTVLYQHDYHPYLSTKVPLDEVIVQRMAELGVTELQISVDTFINEHLCAILKVGGSYQDKLKNMFGLLQKYHIAIYVHTILTSRNDTVEDIESIFEFIKQFDNIKHWKLDTATPSLYKEEAYIKICPDSQKVRVINNLLDKLKTQVAFSVIYKKKLNTYFTDISKEDKEKAFEKRATCSANYSGFFILPDGNVTICEELYWNPRFLIGNVTKQSLLDIWNSDEALNLYYLSQRNISKDSKCKKCAVFEICRRGKGVCWKAIIGVYGEGKWYYPDPLCPQ